MSKRGWWTIGIAVFVVVFVSQLIGRSCENRRVEQLRRDVETELQNAERAKQESERKAEEARKEWESRMLLCDDAFKTGHDYLDFTGDDFEVALEDRPCFSGFVIFPKAWKLVSWQHAPNSPRDGWISIWPFGAKRPLDSQPLDAEQLSGKDYTFPQWKVRLQGHGRVVFFRAR